ncbi:P-loop NTPase fold protein [Streptomyces sp. NPDC049627]|uniref:P-loop NTPase fold protein n=1 Tax=Streptomyces sp. NPDC049627 TaxID=3365595 RepID=UPI0037987E35
MAQRLGADLHGVVEDALVLVGAPEPDGSASTKMLGSGFFVAPGLLITCAHVVASRSPDGDPAGGRVRLSFRGGEAVGVVEWASPRGPSGQQVGLWPLPDLAVVRVTDTVDHACARLSERPPEPGDSLWGYGFTVFENEARAWTGTLTYQGRIGDALRIGGDAIPMGSSGGPLVDPAGAGVCAVLKSRTGAGARDGGLAVPLTVLRDTVDEQAASLFQEIWEKHDAYHLNRLAGPASAARTRGWRSYGSATSAGPGRRTLAGLGSDRPSKVDLLGNEGEVEMLAMLVTALTTTPPLAIALLGEWGSGKSSTMEQMRAHVAAMTERVRRQKELQSAFAVNVRQVRFNAWHYAEDHLWTGLVDHLFRELATDPAEEQPPTVPMADVHRRRDRLRRELEQARSDAERLQAAVDAAEEAVPSGRAAAVGDPMRGPRLLWTEAGTLLRSAWSNRRVVLVWIAVLVSAVVVWGVAGSWIAAAVPLALGAGAAVQPFLRRARSAYTALQQMAESAGKRLDRDLQEANDRVAATADRLAQTDAAVRLSEFLRRRNEEPSPYEPYRSLLSQVRRDLEQLEADLGQAHQEWLERTEPGTGTPPPLQRVILYIDDLDRCSPQRVVDVLAAVHLILALELFVVVVAVDPKWLIKALRVHHQEFFGPGARGEAAVSEGTGPLDYLDKIFQVPFTLSRPGEAATARYLRSLLGPTSHGTDTEPAARAEETAAPQGTPGGTAGHVFAPSVEPPAAEERPTVFLPELRDLRPDTLRLHRTETEFMASLGTLLPTPRAAKKLVNLYRLARISISDGDRDAFVATEHQALQILLAVLVGSPAASQQIFTALADAAGDADVRAVLSSLLESEGTGVVADSCRRTVAVLDQIALRRGLTVSAKSFQSWVPLVARFSFHTGAWGDGTSTRVEEPVRGSGTL